MGRYYDLHFTEGELSQREFRNVVQRYHDW